MTSPPPQPARPFPAPAVGRRHRLSTRLFGRRPAGTSRPVATPVADAAAAAAAPRGIVPPAAVTVAAAAGGVLTDVWFDDLFRHLDRAAAQLRAARRPTGPDVYPDRGQAPERTGRGTAEIPM